MNQPSHSSHHEGTEVRTLSNEERAAIDASTRGPVILFIGSSIFWLVIGTCLKVVADWQLSFPSLLDFTALFTYGRIEPAQSNILIYGWASTAAFGAGLWVTARLSRVPLLHKKLLISAGIIWNLGVIIGSAGILVGDGNSIPGLDFPGYASPSLLIAYALIASWIIITLCYRQPGALFVSQWFIFAGFLCFPWLYATANILLVWNPVQASAQGPIACWFLENLTNLWLAPVAIGTGFYIVPKLISRPIASPSLSVLGFWTLILFGSWTGISNLFGGPIPAWMMGAGVAASIMLIIPVFSIAMNLHLTLSGKYEVMSWSPALRFTVFGLYGFFFSGILATLLALPKFHGALQFSDVFAGASLLSLYGFVSMTFFGAIYYIVPRLINAEWPCVTLIRCHFWLVLTGLVLALSALFLGGLLQGFAQFDVSSTFRSSIEFVSPFRLLSAIASVLFLLGHLSFAFLFVLMLLKTGKSHSGPALLNEPTENSLETLAV